jgi:predicted hotdog family 3-hydroxylacyl-ACP dehydratase
MIDHARIRELIPHAGSMCLIDSVTAWDESQIECRIVNHTAVDHPLRHLSRLSAVHLIEYAAQAAAIHGALSNESNGKKADPGMLVAVRDCELLADTIDSLAKPLSVIARKKLANGDGLIYEFTVSASDSTSLAKGRLSVMLARAPA